MKCEDCKNCYYGVRKELSDGTYHIACHRYPKTLYGAWACSYPDHYDGDWCGEFQQKETE